MHIEIMIESIYERFRNVDIYRALVKEKKALDQITGDQ
jgi:hypothetical protein